jgi:hypothetical protein
MVVSKLDVVRVKITPRMVEEATEYAEKKLENTINRPDLEDRTKEEKFNHIYLGNLAVLSVAEWLTINDKWVEVYDRVRTDKFLDPDLGWDLKVKDQEGKQLEVDVKSSGPDPNTLDLEVILSKRNLATKPSIIGGNRILRRGEERDINVQVYHLPIDREHTYLISWAQLNDLIILTPIPKYQRTVGSYSPANPRRRYDTILETLKDMKSLLALIK